MIREIRPSDAENIAEVEDVAGYAKWSVQAVRSCLALPTTQGWLVEDPTVAGHLIARHVDAAAEVLTLAVRPECRRRGLAAALLQACEAHWRSNGIREAWLEVSATNTAALALYRGRDWLDAGVRRRYYADGSDAAVMRWEAP